MLRVIFSPRWIGMTLLAIAWAAVSVLAAHWQWTRYEDKAAAAHLARGPAG